jgi:hypothetical protein
MPTQIVRVENPAYDPHISESHVNPRSITVSARAGVIETLAARKQLTVEQQQAAQRFRSTYDCVHSAGLRTLSFEPRVDVIGCTTLLPAERLTIAVAELRTLRNLLGQRGYALLVSFVAQDRALTEFGSSRRSRDTMIDMLKLGLDDLAVFWGYRKANAGLRESR